MSYVFPSNVLEGRVGPPVPAVVQPHGSLRSWETWVSLGLIGIAFLAVSSSIEQADWVGEMPSLSSTAMIGLLAGFFLSRVRWPGVFLLAMAAPLGVATALWQTLGAMRLSDPSLGTDLAARWSELLLRLSDWYTALLGGDVSTDPVPFIILVVLLSWAMAFGAAWAIFRLRNGWLAVIPGGFALLTNISYLPGQPSVAFVVYLFAGILLVTRMHAIRADAVWQRDHTARPPLLTLEVLNFATWAGLVLIVVAWSVPTANNWGPIAEVWQRATAPLSDRIERVGRVFFGIDAKRGDLAHKFGEVMPLQGRIRLSNEPLLSVEAPPEVAYLRAATYDEYTGRAWRQSANQQIPFPPASIDAASFGTAQTRASFRKPFVATVELKSTSMNRHLAVPGDPIASDVESNLVVGTDPNDVVGMTPAVRLADGTTYHTVGTLSAATPATLAKAPEVYPQWVVDRYLQLPPSLPAGVREMAASLTRDVNSPYLRARRIEQQLRTQYLFDLNTPDPPPRADAVGSFLLDTRTGYFDQYASAMVVLLRASGVPARLAVGFALDPRAQDPTTKSYTLADRDAWAWPEAYFGGLGWVEFNPTPTRPLVTRAQDDSQFATTPADAAEPTGDTEFGLLSDFEVDPTGGAAVRSIQDSGANTLLAGAVAIFATLASLVVVLALMLVVAAVGVRLLWEWRYRGLSPVVSRWAKLQDLAAWAGVSPLSTRTPLEAAREIRGAAHLDLSLDGLAIAYNRERYGGRLPSPAAPTESTQSEPAAREDAQQQAAYLAARGRLLRLAARRLLPRRGGGRPLPSAIANPTRLRDATQRSGRDPRRTSAIDRSKVFS
ncbi:MAG: transglutaminaseTgpA domain-containing protein [Dehalococcoidia bacterium]